MTRTEHCQRIRQERARKREALGTVGTRRIGWCVFGGPLFGRHRVEILARLDDSGANYLRVDRKLTCAKTQRGMRALLMRRISKEVLHGLGK